jgi:hypothetical protein
MCGFRAAEPTPDRVRRSLSAWVFAVPRRDRQGCREPVRVRSASAPVHSNALAGAVISRRVRGG